MRTRYCSDLEQENVLAECSNIIKYLLHASARRLDRGASAGRGCDAFQLDRTLDLALLHHFHAYGARGDQAGFLQHVEINGVAFDRIKLIQQHFRDVALHFRAEADLRQTALHRHLAAFEPRLPLALAGARVLTFVSAAGSLAEARTDTAANASANLA